MIDNPETTLYETICDGVRLGGNSAPALLFMNAKFSYGKVKKEIDLLAAALYNIGVKKGDIVTAALPNIPQTVYFLYASNAVGAVAYPVHAMSSAEQIGEMMEITGSKVLFALDSFVSSYEPLCKEKGYTLISCNPTYGLNPFVRAAYNLKNKIKLSYAQDYADFIKNNAGTGLNIKNIVRLEPKETAVLLNSGGTSGIPKTVELSAYALNALSANGYGLLDTKDVVGKYMLSVLPYFHGFGLCMGLHAMLWHGGCNVLIPKFKRKTAVAYVRRGKINYMIGVPALYSAMLSHKGFSGKCLKNITIGFVGGDFVPQTVIDAFDERMKQYGSSARLFEGYGLTETVTVACVNTHKDNKRGTVGRAVGGVEIKALATDTLRDFGMDGSEDGCGELCLRGDTLMNGYYKDPEATAKTFFTDEDGVRWLKSGDYGFVDADGFVHFKQRLKRILKVSGVSVFPAEIEQAVSKVDGVSQVCAHAVPDEKKGTAIRLVVETSFSDLRTLRTEIENVIQNSLSRDCTPKEIVFTKSIPLTKMNKIDIETLKTLSAEDLANR